MSESLHGGGIEREEETVAIGVEEGAVGEAGARQTANRRKRTLTAEEEEERQQRRAKIAQQVKNCAAGVEECAVTCTSRAPHAQARPPLAVTLIATTRTLSNF